MGDGRVVEDTVPPYKPHDFLAVMGFQFSRQYVGKFLAIMSVKAAVAPLIQVEHDKKVAGQGFILVTPQLALIDDVERTVANNLLHPTGIWNVWGKSGLTLPRLLTNIVINSDS